MAPNRAVSCDGADAYCVASVSPRLRPVSTRTESLALPRRIARTASVVSRSHSSRRLPLRGLGEGGTLPDQLIVGESPSHDRAEHFHEAPGVDVRIAPLIEAEHLLVEILGQMPRLDGNVCPLDPTLERRKSGRTSRQDRPFTRTRSRPIRGSRRITSMK